MGVSEGLEESGLWKVLPLFSLEAYVLGGSSQVGKQWPSQRGSPKVGCLDS